MHLRTAIIPPRRILDEVGTAVQEACRHAQTTVDEAAERRLQSLPWWTRRRARNGELTQTLTPQIDLIPVEALSVPLAGFGYVTASDSVRLTAALKEAAAEIPCPTVHFEGGAALELDGDRHVWVRLAGDVEALRGAARALTLAVEPLGFFVDRRKFSPRLAVGTVNDATMAPYLQGVVDALDTFCGLPWELDHVTLLRLNYGTGVEAATLERLPLHP